MVFLVPVAFSNLTFLGFQTPFTFDAFDIVKMSLERVLGLVALGAWAWDMLRKGGRIRRTPVDWLILAFLAWVALTTVTSIHWPTAFSASRGATKGCSPSSTTPSSTSSSCSSPTGLRACAASPSPCSGRA